MARFAFVILGVVTCFVAASAMTGTEYGMAMSVRAYDAVCWYENLKQFPKTNSKGYMGCSGQAENVKKQLDNKGEDKQKRYFGNWMNDLAMSGLASDYTSTCGKYLKDASMSPPGDESDALNDANSGMDYPYKGFANCLMHHLREKHGGKAIEAVKNERTHAKMHWMTTILKRDNEFRALHGSDEMKLAKGLSEAAQAWADKNAAECSMYHSKNTDAGRQWQGASTGESLAASGGADEPEIAAYIASNGWYEEIKDYPYPEGYKGGNKALFKKIGHFTQTVWKGTKYVGYGYAYNPNCPEGSYQRYIAARYSPAGNMEGKYPENVLPPK